MKHSFYTAWKYICFQKIKSFILISAISLSASLPICLHYLLRHFEQNLYKRSVETPLLVGAKGSSLDLTLKSLYFSTENSEFIQMGEVERINNTGLGLSIPLYNRFLIQKNPIMGTSIDYFEFRKLELQKGSLFTMMGDCVLGADLARKLNKDVGDRVESSPENPFDFGGVYPLKMTVKGILKKSGTADDRALFCDIKTCWVIEGLGHGHEDLEKADSSLLLKKQDNLTVANASVYKYNTVSESNMKSFHFHGDMNTFSLSSIIIKPHDTKSRDLLIAQYLGKNNTYQIVRPDKIINKLIAQLLDVENFILGIFSLTAVSISLLGVLVIMLSFRLRKEEMTTMFSLGCHRYKTLELLSAELLLLFSFSAFFTSVIALGVFSLRDTLFKLIIY